MGLVRLPPSSLWEGSCDKISSLGTSQALFRQTDHTMFPSYTGGTPRTHPLSVPDSPSRDCLPLSPVLIMPLQTSVPWLRPGFCVPGHCDQKVGMATQPSEAQGSDNRKKASKQTHHQPVGPGPQEEEGPSQHLHSRIPRGAKRKLCGRL